MTQLNSRIAIALAGGALLLPAAAAAQDWQTMSSARAYQGEKALDVELEYGAGELHISPGNNASLYRAQLRYDADVFDPRMKYTQGRLLVGFNDGSINGRPNMEAGRLDLTLGTRVPMDINLAFGAAEADVDLSGLMIRSIRIQTGASETRLRVDRPNRIACEELKIEVGAAQFEATGLGNLNCERVTVAGGVGEVILDLSGRLQRNVAVKVDMGLGSLVLRVPRGTALRVNKEGLLSSFDSQGMIKRGKSYFSENWENARRHVTVDVNAAFGSIGVVWIDNQQGRL